MKIRAITSLLGWCAAFSQTSAQVPQLMNYQGRIQVGTNNFEGTGQFKFALVNANAASGGAVTYWSNDGTSVNGVEPATAVSLSVIKGIYSVLLGDATKPNMRILTPDAFAASEVYLRVWFNDGVNGFKQLVPDQRIAAVGYAIIASTVADGAITTQKLANASVTSEKLGPASVGTTHLNDGAVTQAKLDGSFGFWDKSGSVLSHSGGVGIGTEAPRFALEVSDINSTVAMISGSNPFGTFFGLQNATAGGDTWSIGHSGRSHIQGSGNLIFNRGTGPAKMRIDPEGNLNVAGDLRAKSMTLTGNVKAKNLPFLKFVQSDIIENFRTDPRFVPFPHNVDFTLDELAVEVPSDGFLVVQAHVGLSGFNRAGYAGDSDWPPPWPPSSSPYFLARGRQESRTRFTFWLESIPTSPSDPVLLTAFGDEYEPDAFFGKNAPQHSLSCVVPVQAGMFRFKTRGRYSATNAENNIGRSDGNLTAVFFPSQSE